MDEVLHMTDSEYGGNLGPLIIASFLRDDFPWLYEVGSDVYRKLEGGHPDASESLRRFIQLIERLVHHPMMWEMQERSKERRFEMEEMVMFSHHMLERLVMRTEKVTSAAERDSK